MHGATAAKTSVEDRQRELAKQREASGEKHQSRFFRNVEGDRWMPKLDLDKWVTSPHEPAYTRC
jgi:hypothetical protein